VPTESDNRIATMQVSPKLLAEYRFLYDYVSSADSKPTASSEERLRDLAPMFDEQLASLQKVIDTDVKAFNGMLRDRGVPTVIVGAKALPARQIGSARGPAQRE